MNYIIFGGTGFIGTHLTKLLLTEDSKAKVWNLDLVRPGDPFPLVPGKYHSPLCEGEMLGSTFVKCDVRNPIDGLPFMPTPDDVIFNFAAVHRTPGSPDDDYFETNIRGAENVCDFAEKYGIKRIIFTSSIAPYGAAEELNARPRSRPRILPMEFPSLWRKRSIKFGRPAMRGIVSLRFCGRE